MKNVATIAVVTLTIAACEARRTASETAVCPQNASGISVVDAWTPEGAGTVAAAYLTICNGSNTDDALVGVGSPNAQAAELHATSRDEQGVVRMQPLESLPLPKGGAATLAPGGAHVMLIGVAPDADGIELTLRFDKAPPLTVELERRARN